MTARRDLRKVLADGLARLGYPRDEGVDRLLRYLAEIELWNPRLKLVGASDRELVVRHLLDSLAGAAVLFGVGPDPAVIPAVERIADVGSGAGLPGIPIAIMHPQLTVDLVERSGRRVGFLRNAVAAVRVTNARVVHEDVERYRGQVDLVVHRAFLPLTPQLVETLRRSLAPGGAICAYKGRRGVVDEEIARLDGGDGAIAERATRVRVIPVDVPFLDGERHLVVIQS